MVKKHKNDFNACEDFLLLVVHALISVAAMEMYGMDNLDSIPKDVEQDIWLKSEEEREEYMHKLSSKLVDKMIDFQFASESRVIKDGVLSYKTAAKTWVFLHGVCR